jgi:hypothetical protein
VFRAADFALPRGVCAWMKEQDASSTTVNSVLSNCIHHLRVTQTVSLRSAFNLDADRKDAN